MPQEAMKSEPTSAKAAMICFTSAKLEHLVVSCNFLWKVVAPLYALSDQPNRPVM
jgi:hypothetical protein